MKEKVKRRLPQWISFFYPFVILLILENTCLGQDAKIKISEWIDLSNRERSPDLKLNLISWLVDNCLIEKWDRNSGIPLCLNSAGNSSVSILKLELDEPTEFQSFDGFYNNIFKTDLGAVDTPLLRRVAPVYNDGVYEPVKKNRINPFEASNLMERKAECGREGSSAAACGSKTGKSAFLVYFGQQVVEEILDSQRPGCPPEYFNVEIPKDHPYSTGNPGKSVMPLLRSRYSQSSGHSPGNPRQQLNEITPWIDGGLIYGTSKGWADILRTSSNGEFVEHGRLATDETGLFPARNKLRMPLANPPPPAWHKNWTHQHQTANVNRFFVLGNPRGNENAFILAFGVVLFRWHNQFATYFHKTRPSWSGERIFQESRKWTIATYQQIVINDWLPQWIGEPLEEYKGYDPSVDPQIEQFFQTAAMRFGHTLVTPGAYMRDYACAGCGPISFHGLGDKHSSPPTKFDSTHTVRTCNIFWRPQEPLEMNYTGNFNELCGVKDERTVTDVDRLLMGLASQRAEREDHMIVEDLRGKVFGPLEFSRRDLMAINIQRGRDHGTPDYNTAREAFGLKRINSVEEYMSETKTDTPKPIIVQLEEIHNISGNPWNNIDVWTGGILETAERPGPLFRAIIKDQFLRIRNSDRFWFENKKWSVPRFSDNQIKRIKTLTVFDMVVAVTRMLPEDLQKNPFQVPTDNNSFNGGFSKCNSGGGTTVTNWEKGECYRYLSNGGRDPIACYHLPQLDSVTVPVEECTIPGSYDYFSGSEISFIATYVLLGVFIIGAVAVLYFVSKYTHRKENVDEHAFSKNLQSVGQNEMILPAKEWQNEKDGSRYVVLLLHENKLALRCLRGDLLRDIDLEKIATVREDGKRSINMFMFKNGFLLLENPKEYDVVLEFESVYIKDRFVKTLQERLKNNAIELNIQESVWKTHSGKIITQQMRITMLEKFFRYIFNLELHSDKMKHDEVENIELSMTEFADALGMPPSSDFVHKIFNIVDQDQNGYISFHEFFAMLSIFNKGSAEDKVQFLFKMYDPTESGKVTLSQFKTMMASMISAATPDLDEDTVNASIESMIKNSSIAQSGIVTLAKFQELLNHHSDTLQNVQLNFTGVDHAESSSKNRLSRHKSFVRAVSELNNGYNSTRSPEAGPGQRTDIRRDSVAPMTVMENQPKSQGWQRWIDINRLKIFWCTLYTLVVLAIFAERAYYYSVEREHGGLRRIAGYGVTVTRGAASVMMFCYATLLLTMCRNLITKLRDTRLQQWIPFDEFVAMHKYIACLALLFTIIHVVGHAFNFYSISTQTADDLSCLFRDYHRPTHVLPKFHYWAFQTITGLTGILLVLHATIIYLFATTFARKYAFRAFWITHQSYPLWYILIILHGSGRLVQEPLFLNFLLGPLFLFVLDRIITVGRENMEIPVVEAKLLPSNVTKLTICRPIGFQFQSGQWIRLACLDLNPNEFHPFTISSAPHEENLTVHIRAVGPFTTNIRQIYESSTPKVYLDGPYGENHQDWCRYEVAVLIGGGIGVTPFSSILKDVASSPSFRNCKKIYFLWVTKTQKQFEWMVDIIRDVENHKSIAVHVFITQLYDKFDLRTVLLYICERNFQRVSDRSLFTGLKSTTHFGRPNFKVFFKTIQNKHPNVTRFGVFSCGPLPMSKSVADACVKINNESESDAIFKHHYEHF